MGQTKIDIDTRKRIIALRAKGLSFAKIAEEVGVSKQSAVDECKRSAEQVATLQALEMEALYEECKVTRSERIRAQAELLAKMRKEIARRDFSDMPTDKLIDLYRKQFEALRADLIAPDFKSSEEQSIDEQRREIISRLTSSTPSAS